MSPAPTRAENQIRAAKRWRPGTELGIAIGEAILIEVPLAGLCLLLARDAEQLLVPRSAPSPVRQTFGGGGRDRSTSARRS